MSHIWGGRNAATGVFGSDKLRYRARATFRCSANLQETNGRMVLTGIPVAEIEGAEPAFAPARAFVHELRELGWVDGQTITIARRSLEGDPQPASGVAGWRRGCERARREPMAA